MLFFFTFSIECGLLRLKLSQWPLKASLRMCHINKYFQFGLSAILLYLEQVWSWSVSEAPERTSSILCVCEGRQVCVQPCEGESSLCYRCSPDRLGSKIRKTRIRWKEGVETDWLFQEKCHDFQMAMPDKLNRQLRHFFAILFCPYPEQLTFYTYEQSRPNSCRVVLLNLGPFAL